MTLTNTLAHPPGPWDIVIKVLEQYTSDVLLQKSLLNMITLRHRFDHFQYVGFVPNRDEQLMLHHPIIGKAVSFVWKIRFALPHFPRFYKVLWNQIDQIMKEWIGQLQKNMDIAMAMQILHLPS